MKRVEGSNFFLLYHAWHSVFSLLWQKVNNVCSSTCPGRKTKHKRLMPYFCKVLRLSHCKVLRLFSDGTIVRRKQSAKGL